MSHLDNSGKKPFHVDYQIINRIEIELEKAVKSHFPGLDHFAKNCYCSISKLKYVVEDYYGTSLGVIHQTRRMELAKQLIIKNKNKFINKVAHEVGYENPAKFTEAFKKYYKHCPTEIPLNEFYGN